MENIALPLDEHVGHGYTANKEALTKRLSRIEGQVRGVSRMVNEDKYCIDILAQISAINAALHKVSLGLLEEHVSHCVVNAAEQSVQTGDRSYVDDKVSEVTTAIGRLLR
ncbi:metal-sensitive transcriptional regulator [Paeniglutamicibacter sp. MACA_103]|uniref:metal-sensitive transcriptional regulator n=1 Tax=Paeniglutamicibacter sp. MACA_103 TaxID=3377337 RepID=UPI003894E043